MAVGIEDSLVVLIGGGGFIGRQAAQALFAKGARVRIAQRDPGHALSVKPAAGLGKVQFVRADIGDARSVARALAGADAVVNLVGLLAGDFRRAHVEGAANVARAAADQGLKALVQVSAIGADPRSPSAYGRTKGEGEAAVRAAFPRATIIRPSIVFGPEDQFVNRFADLIRMAPVVPVIGGRTRFQPVYVGDVARAIAMAATDPQRFGGTTYELGGPDIMSMAEINAYIAQATGRERSFVAVPDSVARLLASATGWMPGAPITLDQWTMLQRDNVADPALPGLAAFGISATPLAAVAPEWLVMYRRHGRFARTPA
jgi:NADH dehydrogenase